MPIPTVTCSVCGQTVAKRQTLAVGTNQRACRSHSETQAKSTEQVEKQKATRQKQLDALKRRADPWKFAGGQAPDFTPKCFCCEKVGLKEDDWFARMLLEWHKYEIKTGKTLNPFDPREGREAFKALIGTPRLNYVIWEPPNSSKRLHYTAYVAASMLGVILVCDECMDLHKFVGHREKKMGDLDLDKLIHQMAVMEAARPAIRAIAQRELDQQAAEAIKEV